MKKRISTLGLILIPVSALLINACGPADMAESEVSLDEKASDSWVFINGVYSEYGHCNNALDDNGNGLVDSADPDCHVNPGPLRDLSLYDFPVGHNYFPDVRMDLPGGPGYLGKFRDPALITRWFRFLTEADGDVAATQILGNGVNPEIVPIPAILPLDTDQGTTHQGNNNDINITALHAWDMFHPVPAMMYGAAAAQAPNAEAIKQLGDNARYIPMVSTKSQSMTPGDPGWFYRAQGPFSGNGSQGAIKPARTGNQD